MSDPAQHPRHVAGADNLATTLAVLVARVTDTREDVGELRRSLENASADKVTRGEWGQRNEHVNSRLQSLGREVAELRAAIHAKTAPWWSVAAVVVAALALVWSVLGDAIRAA